MGDAQIGQSTESTESGWGPGLRRSKPSAFSISSR